MAVTLMKSNTQIKKLQFAYVITTKQKQKTAAILACHFNRLWCCMYKQKYGPSFVITLGRGANVFQKSRTSKF
jgi:hypothetical protein